MAESVVDSKEMEVCGILVPDVIVKSILGQLDYQVINRTRAVCQKFNVFGVQLLNEGFDRIIDNLTGMMTKLDQEMPKDWISRMRHKKLEHFRAYCFMHHCMVRLNDRIVAAFLPFFAGEVS